jgi:hypothetical protein
MTANCVLNIVIEGYHTAGKLDVPKMKAFNQEVSNKMYTFLTYLISKSDDDRAAFMATMSAMYPSNWDQPKFDRDFTTALRIHKRIERRFPRETCG